MNLGDLEFKAEDFSRSELQGKFGEDAPWFYERLASIANMELRERLAKAPVVYGMFENWSIDCCGVDTHQARLVCIEEIK